MTDIQSNIQVNIDTTAAAASLKNLQRQISVFHTSMSKSGAAASAVSANMQQNLINSINRGGEFAATMKTVKSSAEGFTTALEKNKLSMGQYFKYAGASTKTFGRLFTTEFNTIEKVARERVKTLQTQYIKLGRDANGAIKSIAVRPLALDMESLATKTQMAAQKQQLFNQLMKQGSTNLLNFGKNTQWAGRQLMVGFTIPLALAGTTAAKAFMEMEKQAVRFKRVYGELFTTNAETDKMAKEIEQLGKEFTKYGIAVSKTMELAADVAATGKMGAELTAQVAESTRLAVLGGVEQAEALQATISLTDAFGVSAEQLAEKIDFLNAVENQTITSIEDLTVAIPKAGPVIEQLGGDVEDLTFFLTAMREGGINASEGANALKSGLAAMINPTGKAAEFLQSFGINLKAIVETNKGDVKGTVIEFAKALDTLDPLNRAQAIEQLFGKFQFSRLSTLFQNVIKEGNQASRVLKLTSATTEELAILSERELKRVEDSPMFKFQKSIEDLKISLVPVGEAFLKAVTPIVDFGAKLLEKFNNLDEGAKSFVIGITAVLGAIGPIAIMSFGLLANGVANIIKGFMFVKNVFTGAGNSSKELGSQLQYMTNEQLEAASVAASLDQVHNRLVQTFSSEASALANLEAAYRKAISAQSAFSVSNASRGPRTAPRAKMANGGMVRGPGGPKDDLVPTDLSNGEAVIDAATVEKNPRIINALFAGKKINIPGYAENNKKDINSPVSMYGGSSRMLAGLAAYLPGNNSSFGMERSLLSGSDNTLLTQRLTGAAVGGGFALDRKDGVFGGTRSRLSASLMDEYGSAVEEYIPQIVEALKETHASMLSAGEDVSKIDKVVAKAEPKMRSIFDSMKARGGKAASAATAMSDHMMYPTKDAMKSMGEHRVPAVRETSDGKVKPTQFRALKSRFVGSVKTASEYFGPKISPQDQYAHLNGSSLPGPEYSVAGGAFGPQVSEDRRSKLREALKLKTERMSSNVSDSTQAGKLTVQKQGKAFADGIKDATKQASPSKEAYDAGANVGIGAINGIKSTARRAQAAGQTVGEAVSLGASQSENFTARKPRRARSQEGYYENGKFIPTMNGNRVVPGMSDVPMGPAKPTRMQKLGSKARTVKSNIVSRGISGRGLGGAGMAASGVMMAASMAPGQIGELAQQAIMPVMALTAILPLLSSGFGIAVVALGAIAAAVIALNMQFDAAQKSALDLAESMGTGAKAMEGYAKFAGNATAGEVMDKRRANSMSMFQIQTGKTTFGQSYVQGEEGKQKIKDVKSSMQTSGRGATVSSMVNQMATAVASGALDAGQARSIVANLASEMGDMSFGMQVTGQLNEIIGPNGENLAKDPLKVRMELMENTRSTMNKGSDSLKTAMTMTGKDSLQLGGGLAAGAAAGAATGAIAGTVVPLIGTAVGAVAGTIVGAIGGGIVGSIERSNRIAAASGAMVGLQKEALQQQQEMIDSLDLTYQRKIEEAKAAGDVAEAERLTNEYLKARPDLIAAQGRLNKDIQASYEGADAGFLGLGGARAAMNSGADKAIAKTFEGTANEDMANVVKDQIKGASLTDAQDYNLRIAFSTGDIDPLLLSGLLSQFGSNADVMNKTMNIITTMGGAFAADTLQIMNMFVDKDGKPLVEQQTKFIANMSAKSPEEATKYLDLFLDAKNIGQVVDLGATMSFYVNNPGAQKAMMDAQKMIDENKGKMSMSFVSKVVGASNLDAVLRAGKDFSNLDAEQQKVFTSTMKNILLMEGNKEMQDAYKLWLTEPGNSKKMFDDFAVTKAVQVTQAATDTTTVTKPVEPKRTGGGGSGPAASMLDSLLQKLKEIRQVQVKVTTGFAASAQELMKWLGGAKDIKIFSGIKQQMRALGAGEDLITLIAGMDPKEYEKQKNKLFEFDKKGNIVKLKSLALATGKALKEIALGEFQNQQQQIVVDLNNQNTALKRLVAAGISVSDAYNMVEDATLAAAIASKKLSDAELKKIVAATKEAIKQMKIYKAAQGVSASNAEFAQNSKVVAKLAASNYTDEQRKAILDSADLQTLYLESSLSRVNFDKFQKALANAVSATKLEIDINKLTTEGLETNFANAMSRAMERVNAQETQINLRFDSEQKGFNDLIEKTQQQIADYQYEIDDLDASLRPIEEAEKRINEQYDARIKALDEVSSINNDISTKEKQQLSIAEAITSGDIAAAARAAQEARAANAASAVERQKKSLEKNKDLTLAGLVNAQGLTRLQVEQKLEDLKTKIFDLEEQTLEPAQRALELSERRRDVALQQVEADKLSLALLQNRIDLAKTAQPDYVNAIGDANAIGNDLENAYNNGGNVADPNALDNGPTVTPVVAPVVKPAPKPVAKPVAKPVVTKPVVTKPTTPPVITRPIGQAPAAYASQRYIGSQMENVMITPAHYLGSTFYPEKVVIVRKPVVPVKNVAPAPPKSALNPRLLAMGGMVDGYASGGVVPKYFNRGGIAAAFANTFANNTDTIPAMLSPGEFVIKKSSVDQIGYKNLQRLNNGETFGSHSVYNYDVSINVRSEANVNDISRAVITEIKRIDSQRVRGNRL